MVVGIDDVFSLMQGTFQRKEPNQKSHRQVMLKQVRLLMKLREGRKSRKEGTCPRTCEQRHDMAFNLNSELCEVF